MPRFAYVLMTDRNERQLVRLAARLRELSPRAHLLVRHDARGGALESADALQDVAAVVHQYRTPLRWGGWSMVEAQLRELRWLRENTDADHIVFLSGQDYPLSALTPHWGQAGTGDHRARRSLYRYVSLGSASEAHCRLPTHSWHPVTFTSADLGELRAADAPFARKFDDAADAFVLDELDQALEPQLAAGRSQVGR